MKGAQLAMAVLIRADLTTANLTGARMAGAYMESADLTATNLENATLPGATLYGVFTSDETQIATANRLDESQWLPLNASRTADADARTRELLDRLNRAIPLDLAPSATSVMPADIS